MRGTIATTRTWVVTCTNDLTPCRRFPSYEYIRHETLSGMALYNGEGLRVNHDAAPTERGSDLPPWRHIRDTLRTCQPETPPPIDLQIDHRIRIPYSNSGRCGDRELVASKG